MKENLTRKETKFLEKYLEGASLAACAKAYGSKGKNKETLAVRGHQILKKINLTAKEVLEQAGFTDGFALKPLEEGLRATRFDFATWRGEITDERERPDYAVREKYLEMYHKLRGNFTDKVELTGKDGGELVIVVGESEKKGKKKDVNLDL